MYDDGDVKSAGVLGAQVVHQGFNIADEVDVLPFHAGDLVVDGIIVVAGLIPALGNEVVAELVVAEVIPVTGEDLITDVAQRFAAVGPELFRGHHTLVAVGNDIVNSVDEGGLSRSLIACDRGRSLCAQVEGRGRSRRLGGIYIGRLSGIGIRRVRRIIVALGSGLAFAVAIGVAVTVDVAVSAHRVLRGDDGADIRCIGLVVPA